MKLIVRILGTATLLIGAACAHKHSAQHETSAAEERTPASAPSLPGSEAYASFYETARTLQLSDKTLTMSSGGTSVYAVVQVNGKPLGGVLPQNAATVLSGEVMAFHLALALGIADIYQPGAYYDLSGPNLAAFRKIIPSSPFANKLKESNRVNILSRIQKSPNGIPAIFKIFGTKPKDYDALVGGNAFKATHKLPGSTVAFGQFLKCNGPQPSRNVQVTLNGGSNNEYALAKQLSSIFLIDALTQQWDRFSGGNLQTLTENGVVKFVSFDNGGTWGRTKWTSNVLAYVSRFDPQVANRILEMNELFENNREFLGIRNEQEFIEAFGIRQFPGDMPKFKESLKIVAAHIKANRDCLFQ